MKDIQLLIISCFITTYLFAQTTSNRFSEKPDSIATHKVVLDDQSRLISWIVPQSKAYDLFLHQRWNFIKTKAPISPGPAPRSSYPQYYFYCDFDNMKFGEASSVMNDVGEKFQTGLRMLAYIMHTQVIPV